MYLTFDISLISINTCVNIEAVNMGKSGSILLFAPFFLRIFGNTMVVIWQVELWYAWN